MTPKLKAVNMKRIRCRHDAVTGPRSSSRHVVGTNSGLSARIGDAVPNDVVGISELEPAAAPSPASCRRRCVVTWSRGAQIAADLNGRNEQPR